MKYNRSSIAYGCMMVRSRDTTLNNHPGDMVQGRDPESRTVARDLRKEDIEVHTANRGGRLDREVPIMPNTLAMRLGPGFVLSREDEIVGPGTVGKSLRRVDIEARIDQMSEAVDNLAMALSLVQGHEGMTIDNTMTGLQSIAMLVLGIVRLRQLHLILLLRVIRNCGAWRNSFAIRAKHPQHI